MIYSNCLLSIIGTVLSLIGTYSFNDNLECFGWGMILVSVINAIGWIVDTEREKRKKDETIQS